MRTATIQTALCQLRLGHPEVALTELARADAINERVRRQSGADKVREALDAQAQPLYDELVRLQLAAGRPEAAFGYAELSRARRLADALGSSQVTLPRLQAVLPKATALVAYYRLRSETLAFLVRHDRAEFVALPSAVASGGLATARQCSQGRGSMSDCKRDLAVLYRQLIAPLRSRLAATRSLVIVPHRELFMVPFPALYDEKTHRFLVEDFRLEVAPSAAVFVSALARSAELGGRDGKVLAVSVASAPSGLAEILPGLPRAEGEARAVASLYGRSQLLEGEAATPSRFLEQARRSAVVHFAGHAVASAADPALSFLALSPAAAGPSVLYAQDIARVRWPATRLVVLSSCRTVESAQPDAEGIQGLARAFLAAGVPAVVGALWNVDDDLAYAIARSLHRRIAGGFDPASALRAAQLAVLAERPDEPPGWAAFQMIGGVDETSALH